MRTRQLRQFCLAIPLLMLWHVQAIQPRQELVEWDVDSDIVASDKEVILKLVRELGLKPKTVGVVIQLPTGDRVIHVKSAILVQGKHRTWHELPVCRRDWDHCNNDEGRSLKRVGRWLASKADLAEFGTWRIEDGDWTREIPVLPAGIAFADAERIVLAIRRKQLVNRLPPTSARGNSTPSIPEINPNEITVIRRIETEPSAYEVTTGVASGMSLRVVIVGEAVELRGYSTYTV